ncbi:ODA11 [Symbiodinium sp. KB8]|nr:ODA11 [Symbiodinium sp. KB8]
MAAADAALESTTPEEGLRSAIEDLGRALRRAETCEVSPDLVQQGRDKLEECQRRLQTLEAGRAEAALLEAMKGSDMSQLELAIDRASSAGVSPEVIDRAQEHLRGLEAKEEAARATLLALNELLAAMKLSDLHALQKALDAAKSGGVSDEILLQGEQKLAFLLEQQEAEAQLLKAITGDMATLTAALVRAEAAKVDGQVCARARDALLRMKRYEAEHATEELIAAMAGEDAKALELALLRAREVEVDANLIQDAEAALQDLRELAQHGPERREAEAELQAAIDTGDLVLLEAALAKARALRVSEEVLRAAQSVLTAAEAQSDLFRAMDGRNIQALMAALQRAETAGVDAGYLHMAQERLRALQEAQADHAEDDILHTLQQREHDFDVPRRPSLHHADSSSHTSLDARPLPHAHARPNLHQLPQQSPAPGGQKEGSISAVAYGSDPHRWRHTHALEIWAVEWSCSQASLHRSTSSREARLFRAGCRELPWIRLQASGCQTWLGVEHKETLARAPPLGCSYAAPAQPAALGETAVRLQLLAQDLHAVEEKRFAYTTPKSFLELIKLYSGMLGKQVFALADKKSRLSSGLIKLRATQEEVANLEEDLQEKAVIVKEKAEKADTFAEEVGREKTKVNTEAEKANIEAVKCAQIAQQVAEKKEDCMRDLDAALPLVNQAEAALDVLDKKEFNELKALTRPPDDVAKVCETALHLLAGIDPAIETDKKGRAKEHWASRNHFQQFPGIQKMMTNPEKFLAQLKGFKLVIDEGKVPPQNVEEARKIKDGLGEDFYPDNMKKKSQAAGGLSEFVINIIKYYDVVCQVEPKKRSLQEATETLEKANERHREVTGMVKDYGRQGRPAAVSSFAMSRGVWRPSALAGLGLLARSWSVSFLAPLDAPRLNAAPRSSTASALSRTSRFQGETFSRSSVTAACLPETFVPPTRDGNEGVYVSEDSCLAELAGSIENLGTWQHWYRPPWFLKQGDLMTLFAALCRSSADLTFKRHIITTKDSGALALDLVVKDSRGRTAPGIASQAPLVLLLPGLGGSSQGGYVKNMANKLTSSGFAVGVLNMRGCAGCSLRTPRFFSAYRGSTNDVREAVDYVRSHLVKPSQKEKPVFLLGWSLGANILINTLAEQGRDTRSLKTKSFVNGGVALCATHCLVRCGQQARDHWVTKYVYSRFVTRNLRKCLQPLSRYGGPVPGWNGTDIRVDSLRLQSAQEVFDIDEALIRRMFGYTSVDEYYYDASSCRRVEQVAVPLLMVSAADDPMSTGWVPFDKVRANPNIMLAYTSHGGHLGWQDASNALRSGWVEEATAAFLQKLKTP